MDETEPTSTLSGFRVSKFCSTKLLCSFFSVVIGLGCLAFALSSYGSAGVSELLDAVSVPDAVAIPVSNRMERNGSQHALFLRRMRSCISQVLDLSNTTPTNEFSPTVRGTAFAPSAALPTIVDNRLTHYFLRSSTSRRQRRRLNSNLRSRESAGRCLLLSTPTHQPARQRATTLAHGATQRARTASWWVRRCSA